jgi:lipopolysaccharide transport system permease protein
MSSTPVVSPLEVAPPSLANPFCFLAAFWRHRALALSLARRRVEAHYRGAALGMFWAVLQPLLLLSIYTFVFSSVLGARWGPTETNPRAFALHLFSGLVLFQFYASVANDAPNLMLSHATYLKQVIFPAEVLPMASLLAALFDLVVGLALWIGFYGMERGVPPPTALGLLLIVIPIALLAIATSWLLSSLGVFLRDLAQLTSLAVTALMFLSPIFYPVTRVPAAMRDVYDLNPFAHLLDATRQLLFDGAWPDWGPIAVVAIGAWLFAWGAYAWFMRTRHTFADVL